MWPCWERPQECSSHDVIVGRKEAADAVDTIQFCNQRNSTSVHQPHVCDINRFCDYANKPSLVKCQPCTFHLIATKFLLKTIIFRFIISLYSVNRSSRVSIRFVAGSSNRGPGKRARVVQATIQHRRELGKGSLFALFCCSRKNKQLILHICELIVVLRAWLLTGW